MFIYPLNHSISLIKQFFNFKKIHKEDTFFKNYMSFLGHFEFGVNHKTLVLGVVILDLTATKF